MELKHIDIANLSVSAANMRAKGKPDIANILPSIRARGILVPLIVRPSEGEDRFEIVAGKRRYHAALAIVEGSGESEPLPCAIMAAGDDAAALEASLIENVARLDPDEVTRWESFTRLVREGRSPEDIALTFGLTELQVMRTLALGNLLPRSDAIAESVESSVSEAVFDEKRRAVLAVLGFDPETPTVTGGYDGKLGVAGLFVRLIELPDPAVLDVAAIVMGETLEAGSAPIEVLGPMLGTDMAKVWQTDDALLDMIRDREVLHHVLVDVAGGGVADANEAATGKVKRKIVRDCLTGENGRARVEGWVPKWMAFPPAAYTERGGVATVSRAATVAELAASPEPEPLRQAA